MAVALKRRRFTVDEYHRMAEAGILTDDDRVELLDGEIIEMAPIGPRHSGITDRLNALFTSRLGSRVIVRVQGPILLAREDSEPQPDVTLLRPRADFYSTAHPGAADAFLVVEVMYTPADRDRRLKLPVYARAGIPEVWLVDLDAEAIEVYRVPAGGGYAVAQTFGRGQRLAAGALPDLQPLVDEILG